jgi:release factor glutamine methyltransferase
VTETLSALLRSAAQKLLAAHSVSAQLDAEVLLAHCLNCDRADMLLRARDLALDDSAARHFDSMIARRLACEPVAYITGEKEFWSLTFKVGPGVLIPRPDSELLVETAILHFSKTTPLHILDLGTGPGTLLLAALSEFKTATGTGIDMSEIALEYARHNARRFGLADRTTFIRNTWLNGIGQVFDLILCNPPYIAAADCESLMPDVVRYEPAEALFGGTDGLSDYRILLPQIARCLAPKGIALLEMGPTQASVVEELATKQGLDCRVRPDLAGRPRCCVLQHQ